MTRHSNLTQRDARSNARQYYDSPLRTMERFADEVDRVLEDFGFGRSMQTGRSSRPLFGASDEDGSPWTPQVEAFHRDGEFMICADLPGIKKDDVKVDVTEDLITIQGEKKREHEDEHAGVWRSERSYGTFYREIPLPAGAISDQAKASFRDGVLEISMPAPPESARRGRRIEIKDTPIKPTVTK